MKQSSAELGLPVSIALLAQPCSAGALDESFGFTRYSKMEDHHPEDELGLIQLAVLEGGTHLREPLTGTVLLFGDDDMIYG